MEAKLKAEIVKAVRKEFSTYGDWQPVGGFAAGVGVEEVVEFVINEYVERTAKTTPIKEIT